MFPVLVPTTRLTTREALDGMIEKLDAVVRDVRGKAFESFLKRGEKFGSDLEDWFAAERELFRMPESEMKETETGFEIKAAVPGFAAENLHVQVLPELIVIEGKIETKTPDAGKKAEEKKEPTVVAPPAAKAETNVVFSEFGSKRMFRQYKLAAPIEVKDVQAVLDKGMLTITARKQNVAPKPSAIEVPIHTEVVKAGPTALAATATSK